MMKSGRDNGLPTTKGQRCFSIPRFDLSLLYVEDDYDSRSVMTLILRRRFREVVVAENGSSGLQAFIERKPDLVLTDIRMPEMDGIEMARAIHRLSPDIPVIYLSAHGEQHYFQQAVHAGIADYLVKPIDIDTLDEALQDVYRKMNLSSMLL